MTVVMKKSRKFQRCRVGRCGTAFQTRARENRVVPEERETGGSRLDQGAVRRCRGYFLTGVTLLVGDHDSSNNGTFYTRGSMLACHTRSYRLIPTPLGYCQRPSYSP
jgi:hypothetical protein